MKQLIEKHLRSLLKKSMLLNIFYMGLYGASFISSFLLAKIILHFVGLDGYASYMIIVSISNIIKMPWYNIGAPSFTRFYNDKDANRQHLLRLLVLFMMVPLFAYAVASILNEAIYVYFDFEWIPSIYLAGAIMGIATGCNAMSIELLNIKFSRMAAAVGLALPGLVYSIATGCLGASELKLESVITVASLFILISTVLGNKEIYNLVRTPRCLVESLGSREQKKLLYHLASYSIPMIVWILPNLASRSFDRIFISLQFSQEQFAQYGILLLLSQNIMTGITSILNRFSVPGIFLAAASDTGRVKALRMIYLMCGGMAGVGAVFLLISVIYSEKMVSFFTGQSNELSIYLPLMMLGSIIYAAADSLNMVGQVEKKLWIYTPSKLISPLIYIGGGYLMAGKYGIASYAMFYLIASVVHILSSIAATVYIASPRRK